VKTAIFFAAALLPMAVFGLDVYVAPLLYVDEEADLKRNTDRVQADLLGALWAEETGMALQFNRLKDNRINPPESLAEAVTVCRNERIEYLLYGYVTRREHSIQAEVRLFDYNNRLVLQSFFGMDGSTQYDRLIKDMAWKILTHIGDVFKLEIVTEKSGVTRLTIPVLVGYWTPMDSGWVEVLLGTAAAGTGLEVIPTDRLFITRGIPWYLSVGLEAKYRLGVGNPDRYEAYNHTLYLMMPLRLHILLAEKHGFFIGLGYVYFLEFFSMADKYDESRSYIFNNMGLNVDFGYRFTINDTLSIFFRNDFDFLFNEHSLITYSPSIGMNIQVYRKEIKKKW